MKPLYSFTAVGAPLQQVIGQLTDVLNKLLQDRPFSYKDTICIPEMIQNLQFPKGQLMYNITMLFEAENMEAIIDLVEYQKQQQTQAGDGFLRPVV